MGLGPGAQQPGRVCLKRWTASVLVSVFKTRLGSPTPDMLAGVVAGAEAAVTSQLFRMPFSFSEMVIEWPVHVESVGLCGSTLAMNSIVLILVGCFGIPRGVFDTRTSHDVIAFGAGYTDEDSEDRGGRSLLTAGGVAVLPPGGAR